MYELSKLCITDFRPVIKFFSQCREEAYEIRRLGAMKWAEIAAGGGVSTTHVVNRVELRYFLYGCSFCQAFSCNEHVICSRCPLCVWKGVQGKDTRGCCSGKLRKWEDSKDPLEKKALALQIAELIGNIPVEVIVDALWEHRRSMYKEFRNEG